MEKAVIRGKEASAPHCGWEAQSNRPHGCFGGVGAIFFPPKEEDGNLPAPTLRMWTVLLVGQGHTFSCPPQKIIFPTYVPCKSRGKTFVMSGQTIVHCTYNALPVRKNKVSWSHVSKRNTIGKCSQSRESVPKMAARGGSLSLSEYLSMLAFYCVKCRLAMPVQTRRACGVGYVLRSWTVTKD